MSSLGSKAVSGAFWTAVTRVVQQALTLISTGVLARQLAPTDYGVLGMATVFTGFISIFRSLGLTSAIVQRKELSESFLASVYWANILIGIATAGIGMALSPAVAWLYAEPRVASVMWWLSFNFALSGPGGVPEAMLTRALAFRTLAAVEIASGLVNVVVAVTMAKMGYGVWSIVAGQTAYVVSSSIVLSVISGKIPRMAVHWSELKSIVSYTVNLSAVSVVNYFGRNTDNFVVGRFLGAAQLGYYQFAYNLMLLPLQNISHQLGRVLFPVFARMQDDNLRFRKTYVRSCVAIATLTFPILVGMLTTAGPLVESILGPKWVPVIPIFSMLAPVGLVQSVVVTAGQIYIAKGQTNLLLRAAVFSNLLVLPAFAVGLHWGAFGVAASYTISFTIVSYGLLTYAFRLIDLPLKEFLSALNWCFSYSLIMGVCVIGVRLLFLRAGTVPQPVVLACCVAVGVVVYFGLIFWRRPVGLAEILETGPLERIPGLQRLRRTPAQSPNIARLSSTHPQ